MKAAIGFCSSCMLFTISITVFIFTPRSLGTVEEKNLLLVRIDTFAASRPIHEKIPNIT